MATIARPEPIEEETIAPVKKKKAAAKGKTKETETPATTINITAPKIERVKLTLRGISPLIVHKWSDKAKKMMLAKQMKQAKTGKAAKDPAQDFYESLYWLDGMPTSPTAADLKKARFGFPVVGFKGAAVDACSHIDGVTKVLARGAFHIDGEFATIKGIPSMREDMVRVGMGVADIRYRAEFKEWTTTLPLRINTNVLSIEQVVNLFLTAGFAIGVGEWRPSRDGSFGMFEVVNDAK
jgi:hypothetical protein